ncbi:hypothetical protein ACFW96_14830 [Streptomyces gardneri]|uniref:hypothetical protein n=1 Tax=Streptomyces gardneri TaxID=66892 RepID=UPI003684C8BA
MEWGGYRPFQPVEDGPMEDRSRAGARDVAHQHPVIMRVTQLRNKRYNVDPFPFAVGTGGSSLGGRDARGSFRNFVGSAVLYA